MDFRTNLKKKEIISFWIKKIFASNPYQEGYVMSVPEDKYNNKYHRADCGSKI